VNSHAPSFERNPSQSTTLASGLRARVQAGLLFLATVALLIPSAIGLVCRGFGADGISDLRHDPLPVAAPRAVNDFCCSLLGRGAKLALE
jgi:hypothetical protein